MDLAALSAAARERVALESERLGRLERARDALRAALGGSPPLPWTQRRARERELARVERDIHLIRSGTAARALDARLADLRRALARVHTTAVTATARGRSRQWYTRSWTVLPSGNRSKTRVRGVRTVAPSTAAEKREALVDQFRSEVLDEALPTLVAPSGLCPTCGRPLIVLVEGSLVGCPSCGVTRAADASTRDGATAAGGRGIVVGGFAGRGGIAAMPSVEGMTAAHALDGAPSPPHLTTPQPPKSQAPQAAALQAPPSAAQEARLLQTLAAAQSTRFPPDAARARAVAEALAADPACGDLRAQLRALDPRPSAWPTSDAVRARGGEGLVASLRAVATPSRVREVLRQLQSGVRGARYDDCVSIAAALLGERPPPLPSAVRSELLAMLREALPVYQQGSEGNLWGGHATFARCALHLLGYDEIAERIPIPNVSLTREPQRRVLWRRLGWEFLPLDEPLPPIRIITSSPPQPPPPPSPPSPPEERSEPAPKTRKRPRDRGAAAPRATRARRGSPARAP